MGGHRASILLPYRTSYLEASNLETAKKAEQLENALKEA